MIFIRPKNDRCVRLRPVVMPRLFFLRWCCITLGETKASFIAHRNILRLPLRCLFVHGFFYSSPALPPPLHSTHPIPPSPRNAHRYREKKSTNNPNKTASRLLVYSHICYTTLRRYVSVADVSVYTSCSFYVCRAS